MKEFKGEKSYVALGASEVRRRLKGHGFGVRKIHSDGKNQAVIIHTATGDHLRQLGALFHDVLTTPTEIQIPPEIGVLMDNQLFEQIYQGQAPWDTGLPQPAIVKLAEAGQIRGSVLDVGCGTGAPWIIPLDAAFWLALTIKTEVTHG